MPPREWRFRIHDLLDAIESIRAYTEGMDFTAFRNDRKTVDAVVRNLTIIGEAAARVPERAVRARCSVGGDASHAEPRGARVLRRQRPHPLGHRTGQFALTGGAP
jgi:hypothetical protein